MAPIALPLSGNYSSDEYFPVIGDTVFTYSAGGFSMTKWDGTGWSNGEPMPALGQGFFLRTSTNNVSPAWVLNFVYP